MRSGSRLRVARGKMFSMQGARRRVHLQWQQSKRQIPRRTTGSGNGQQGEQVCVCELKWASWGLGLGVCPLENTFTRRELFREHAKDQGRRKLLYNGRPLLKEKCLWCYCIKEIWWIYADCQLSNHILIYRFWSGRQTAFQDGDSMLILQQNSQSHSKGSYTGYTPKLDYDKYLHCFQLMIETYIFLKRVLWVHICIMYNIHIVEFPLWSTILLLYMVTSYESYATICTHLRLGFWNDSICIELCIINPKNSHSPPEQMNRNNNHTSQATPTSS